MSTTPLSIKSRLSVLFCAVAVGACAPRLHPAPPVATPEVVDLGPQIEDGDAGSIRMRPGFSPASYTVIVAPFKVSTTGVTDAKKLLLAQDMVRPFQTQLVKRLQLAGIFAKVIDANALGAASIDENSLRLEGEIASISEGSRAMRATVGLGMGAAEAGIETRLLDARSQRVELITSDRRNAPSTGLTGGDSRELITQAMCQMADGYVKLLERLSSRKQANVKTGSPCLVTSDWPVAAGAEVRLLVPSLGDTKRIGIVASATQDTLFFREEPQVATRSIGVRDITQLDVVQGTHTHRRRDAGIGLSIGAVLGGIAGAVVTKTHPPCPSNSLCVNLDGLDRTMNGILGGSIGGLLGALIGAASGGVDNTWVPVTLPRNH